MSDSSNSIESTPAFGIRELSGGEGACRQWLDRGMLWVLLAEWALATELAAASTETHWEWRSHRLTSAAAMAVSGGMINLVPVWLAAQVPGRPLTRHAIVAAQAFWAAQLAAFAGGDAIAPALIGVLALPALYADWPLFVTGCAAVALEMIAGDFWGLPPLGAAWRTALPDTWLEVSAVLLLAACVRADRVSRRLDRREAELAAVPAAIEREVQDRSCELVATAALYQTLLENTGGVPWELDPDTLAGLYVGPQVERLWGWTPNQFAQPGFILECTHPEDRATMRRALTHRDPAAEATVDCRIRKADGSYTHIRSHLNADANCGRWRAIRGISVDVSRQKVLELELQQAQKLESVGRLASGVAHEINTPVQFVSDSCEFLREGLGELHRLIGQYQATLRALAAGTWSAEQALDRIRADEQAADLPYLAEHMPLAVERALEGLQRVANIVRSMREFAHPDQKEMVPADLNHAILSTLTIARNEYKYVAEVRTELGELPPVDCFLGDFNQAILNIVVNAAHAIADVVGGSGRKGEIRVRTWCEAADAFVSIQDSGGGIPEAIRDKIFDPFFTTKQVGKGSGQGLAIVRSVIVDKHKGDLRFESAAGVGTTFTIRLPLQQRRAPAEGTAV